MGLVPVTSGATWAFSGDEVQRIFPALGKNGTLKHKGDRFA